MIAPGYHLYRIDDGSWRCAGPGDSFLRPGAPDEVLIEAQRHLHTGESPGRSALLDSLLAKLTSHGIVAPATDDDARQSIRRPPPEVAVVGTNAIAAAARRLVAPHARVVDDERAADVVVACSGWLPDQRWLLLDDELGRTATPWHMTYFEGDTIVVGPMSIPRRTACYRDTRGRRLAAAASPRELLAHWAYLDGAQPKPPPPPLDDATASLVASILAADVLGLLQTGRPPSEGYQLIVRPHTLELNRHRVLPLPEFASEVSS